MGSYLPGFTALEDAIANAEGYGVPGAIPTVNNNPGDITSGGQVQSFASPSQGWAALDNQISAIFSGNSSYYSPSESLSQFANTYAGGGQGGQNELNNINSYLNGLGFNVTPNTSLADIVGQGIFGSPTAASNVLKKDTNKVKSAAVDSLLTSRFAAGAVGFALIVVGLLMFKQTQTVIEFAGKQAVNAAKVGAVA